MSISKLNPYTAEIVLHHGDDRLELGRLAEAVEKAEKQAKDSARLMSEDDPAEAARAAYNERLAEADKRAVRIVLRSVGRKKWRELVAAHPPREGNEADKAIGVNEDTFPDALVPACMASPTFDSDAERDVFLDSLSSADFDKVYGTAFALNRVSPAAPKALSEPSPTSNET